jgi:hypothetical protein
MPGACKDAFYVSFNSEEAGDGHLTIIIERMPMNVHQINKVLDLMIDGDHGCWVFGADGGIFKSQVLAEQINFA